jgi:hypothetical protein
MSTGTFIVESITGDKEIKEGGNSVLERDIKMPNILLAIAIQSSDLCEGSVSVKKK